MPDMGEYIGAVEAGGTTCRCAVALDPMNTIADQTITTRDPDRTLGDVLAFFAAQPPISHLGVGAFGPVLIDPDDPRDGTILNTPKTAWRNTPVKGLLQRALQVPVSIETDVGAAALAEAQFGGVRNSDTLAYATVGTGIGGALVTAGQLNPQSRHSEMGHIYVPRAATDKFPGCCPSHADCLEGLASAKAIAARWAAAPETLPADHPAWVLQAHYLGHLCTHILRIAAPARILIGGGVLNADGLIEKIRKAVLHQMGDYHAYTEAELHAVIARPTLAPDSGLIGALTLAHRARTQAERSLV